MNSCKGYLKALLTRKWSRETNYYIYNVYIILHILCTGINRTEINPSANLEIFAKFVGYVCQEEEKVKTAYMVILPFLTQKQR